jgi:hypothetical protein
MPRFITHRDVERALLALTPDRVTSVYTVSVCCTSVGWDWSAAGCEWSVGGGPPLLLLPAIDTLMHVAGFTPLGEPAADRGHDGVMGSG